MFESNFFSFFRRQKGDFRIVSLRTYSAMFNCCEKNGFCRLGKVIHGKTVELGYFKDKRVFESIIDMILTLLLNLHSIRSSNFQKKGTLSLQGLFSTSFQSKIWIFGQASLMFHSMLNKELVPNLNLVKLYIKASKEMKLFCHIKHRVMHAYCIRVSNGDLSLQDKNILLKYYLIDPFYVEADCTFFNSIDGKDIITWNTLLHGFAVQHQFERLVIFHELIEQQLSPNAVTFLAYWLVVVTPET